IAHEHPDSNRGWGATVRPWRDEITGRFSSALSMLLGAGGFALLVAAANVANLCLARIAMRQKEFAVRLALGAAKSRIAAQLLTESFLLACLGGAAGAL